MKTQIRLFLGWFLTLSLALPQGYAMDLITPPGTPGQPEVGAGQNPADGGPTVPSGALALNDNPLSAPATAQSPTVFDRPTVTAEGYNADGRNTFPGYVTFVPRDDTHFSYRYDVGAASGATVDVTLEHDGNVMDLTGGFDISLRRVNKEVTHDGVAEMKIIFIDISGNEIIETVSLSSTLTEYNFTLDAAGFNEAAVSQVILRNSFSDLSADETERQEMRRGEIYVHLDGLGIPQTGDGRTFNAEELTEFAEGTTIQGRGFIRGTNTIPGFITLLDENETPDNIHAFRYDVGGSPGAVVNADILSGVVPFALGDIFTVALKNNGNNSKVLVRIRDSQGIIQEHVLNLTDQFQNFDLDLTKTSGFDPNNVVEVTLEVTRELSPERLGRIDFYVPLGEGPMVDPFTQLQPNVTDLDADPNGNAHVDFDPLTDAVIYQVQVATDSNFNNVIHEGFPTDPTEPFFVDTSEEYFVRVRGSKNADVNVGPVSRWTERSFTAQVIYDQFIEARAGSTRENDGVTELFFSLIPIASRYHTQVATDMEFTNIVHEGFPATNLDFANLGENGTYYFRVRGSVTDDFGLGEVSEWSAPLMFERDVEDNGIDPDPTLTPFDITNFPDGEAGSLFITSVGPGGDAFDIATATERGVIVDYDTGTPGWAGGGFTYDNFGTEPFETGDVSGLNELIFGIKGDHSVVKFEAIDDQGNSVSLFLNGVDASTEKYWKIPTSRLTGIDLTKLRIMYFIVEGANKSGALEINRIAPPAEIGPSPTLTPVDIVDFSDGKIETGELSLVTYRPETGVVAEFTQIDRGAEFTFDTGIPGWAAFGVSYDNFGTPEKEGGDLTGLEKIVVGLKGEPSTLKLVMEDHDGNRQDVIVTGVSQTVEQVYEFPMSLFSDMNLTNVSTLFFLIEGQNLTGDLLVYNEPLT